MGRARETYLTKPQHATTASTNLPASHDPIPFKCLVVRTWLANKVGRTNAADQLIGELQVAKLHVRNVPFWFVQIDGSIGLDKVFEVEIGESGVGVGGRMQERLGECDDRQTVQRVACTAGRREEGQAW